MNRTIKLAIVALACSAAVKSAVATTTVLDVGLTDPYAVGDVCGGIQAGGQVNRDVTMVNNLLTLALNTQSTTVAGDLGDLYQRTANNFGSLPAAIGTGAQFASTGDADFTGSSLLLTLTQGFRYLVVAYDGGNGGAEIYDISGIAVGTTLQIPRNAQPIGPNGSLAASTKYQMTGWTLLNPGTPSVPDGGATIALLGVSLIGLSTIRKKLS